MNRKRFTALLLSGFFLFSLIFIFFFFHETSTVKIACVGDSITYGAKIENKKTDTYPAKLQKKLGSRYLVKNFGASGHTLQDSGDRPYRSNEKYQKSLSFQPDIVLIMLGTNDTKPYNWVGKEAFIQDYKSLIRSYQELSSRPAVYLMTPATVYPENYTPAYPYQIQADIADEISFAVKELSEELNLPVIDIHSATAGHPEFFLLDGVHPDAMGAEYIAEYVCQALTENKN